MFGVLNVMRNFATKAVSRKKKRSLVKSKTLYAKKIKTSTLPIYDYPRSRPTDYRIYSWGLQEHGALGVDKKISFADNGTPYAGVPHRLSFGEFRRVKDVACGYGFTAFALKTGNSKIVFGCGINSDSQLGYNLKDEKLKVPIIKEPRPIHIPIKGNTTKVLGLAAGRAHLLVLTEEGLYALGNNGYGQCGRPIISNENYLHSKAVSYIPDVRGDKITGVYAGQDHSMVLTEKGEVYAFGWGADGQTGLGHYNNEYKPSAVKGAIQGQKIIKLACTADCVLALSDQGKVFGWGNSEYRQLPALGHNQQINLAIEVKACNSLGEIVDIAAGGSFCMALNSQGEVFVWGFGILGLGPDVQSITQPTLIPKTLFGANPYEPNSKVVKIFCGVSQLGAITNYGHLYMWGRNKFGTLGIGSRNDQYFPLRVSIGALVQKACCGVDHMVALCKPFI
ncbi:RCC1-like G exchanging factor-like protein [Copidosoma floridanum]|uniref:RCC1-like G exchanging factor-like protein n=1 Tax=Copidosoma floridanum TaxID=29053 RepID=UPI0006C95598|nr:RCC1-like G exchanging factor-like protein [Copidosoma floridanum]